MGPTSSQSAMGRSACSFTSSWASTVSFMWKLTFSTIDKRAMLGRWYPTALSISTMFRIIIFFCCSVG